MRKLIYSSIAGFAVIAAASTAAADSCNDAYAAWKQEALKDGVLINSIHTGKRAHLWRQQADKYRERMGNLKGSDPACRSYLAWLAAESAKSKKMVKVNKRYAFAKGDTMSVSKSNFGRSANRSDFVNRPLYDRNGDYIGTVDDIVVVNGTTRYIIVSESNFMGSREQSYIVPMSALRTTRKQDVFLVGTFRDRFYRVYPRYDYVELAMVQKKAQTDKTFQKNLDDVYRGISPWGR